MSILSYDTCFMLDTYMRYMRFSIYTYDACFQKKSHIEQHIILLNHAGFEIHYFISCYETFIGVGY